MSEGRAVLPPEAGSAVYSPIRVTQQQYYGMTIPEGVAAIEDGDTLWTCVLDTVVAYEGLPQRILPSEHGGCWTVLGPAPGSDQWDLFRLDSAGEVVSSGGFTLQGGPVIYMSSLSEAPDGGLVMTGSTDSLGMNLYLVAMGFDGSCNEEWRVLEDFRFHASGDILDIEATGNILVAGHTGSERDDGWFMPPQDIDLLLMMITPDGSEIWRSVYPYPGQNTPRLASVLPDGGVLVLMILSDEASSFPSEHHLVRFDPE